MSDDTGVAIGSDGTVYTGSAADNVYALNPADGSIEWKYTAGGPIAGPPAIGADGTIYALSEDGNLYALNADGTKKWSVTIGSADYYPETPAIGADGTLYLSRNDGNIYAVH